MPNRQPGLLPPYGKWRGSTIDGTYWDWMEGADPYTLFEDVWNVPLHIYRTFKNKGNAEIRAETEWIDNGGILFYSIQPKDYQAYGPGGSLEDEIEVFADAIAAVSPSQVMVAVGFEPDLYVVEGGKKYYGTP